MTLAEEIIRHTNHDKILIGQAIKLARQDHNYTLAQDLEEALPKKNEEAQLGAEMYDLGVTSAMNKREAAAAKMKQDVQIKRSEAPARPANASTETDLMAVPPKPITASGDLPSTPAKPTGLATADASHSSLGILSPSHAGVVPKPTGNSVA